MANDDVVGTPWADDELDAVVADYFAMLEADLAGRPYVKARHNEALRERIRRSHGSVEYKHQNISAVLVELGMSWLPGYKPAVNYQNALVDAVDRYLSGHDALMEPPPPAYRSDAPEASVFVPPPPCVLKELRGSSSSSTNSTRSKEIAAIARSAEREKSSYWKSRERSLRGPACTA